MLPKSMKSTKIYGVEIDTISAGIAQQLYQKSSIAAQGFEEVNVPDSFFDGVIGNVPFGDFKVLDKRYDKYNFLMSVYQEMMTLMVSQTQSPTKSNTWKITPEEMALRISAILLTMVFRV